MRLLTLLTVLDVAASTAAEYVYVPVEFAFGSDSRVTANFTFGSSPDTAPIKTVMDTGSSDFWVWESNATVHWGSPYLGVIGPCNQSVPFSYNPSKSNTSIVTYKPSSYYYAGNAKIVSGAVYANDTVTPINGNGPIPNVAIALEDYGLFRISDDGTCSSLTYDNAIMGLSPVTNRTEGPSFRKNLYNSGAIAAQTMIMWFDAHLGALGQLTGGVLFGAIDKSKFSGPMVRIPLNTSEGAVGPYVNRPKLSVSGIDFTLDQDVTCLVDSGSHADSLPFDYQTDSAAAFFNATGLIDLRGSGIVAYNGTCESIPQDYVISYTFAGTEANSSVTIDVPVRNYARSVTSVRDLAAGVCELNLEWGGCIFGAPFFSAAVVGLDDSDNSLAFARGGVSAEGSGVEEGSLHVFKAGESF